MGEEKSKKSDELIWMAFVGVLVLLVIAIPATIAGIAWRFLAPRLRASEYWLLVLVGVGAWALNITVWPKDYFLWLGDIVQRDFSFGAIPFLPLLATTCWLLGIFGLVTKSRIATKRLPRQLRDQIDHINGVIDPGDSIVPTAEAKAKLNPAKPLGGTTVHPDQHSIITGGEVGKRAFPLGIGSTGQVVTLSENIVRTHGVILGATGSGKSETIKGLAGALLDLGWSGMLLDLKEDTAPGGLRDWCSTYASYHSLPYQELRLSDPSSPYWFNALNGMGPDEMRDTILTLNQFDDQYWQALNKEMLGQAVNLMVWAHQLDPIKHPAPTMYDIGKLLSAGPLKETTREMRATVKRLAPDIPEDSFRVLANPPQDTQKSAAGFGSKLTQVYDTAAGRTVLRQAADGSRQEVNVTNAGLTYIGLDSQGKPDLTRVVSSSVLQRMSVYASQRTTGTLSKDQEAGSVQRFLIIDEANWVDRTIVQNLLSRARSAGIAVFLCTQGPKDWIDKEGDSWGTLTQNTNVAIIMRQGEPESAELCADYIGTQIKTQVSRSRRVADGAFGTFEIHDDSGRYQSNEMERETVDHIISPQQLRELGIGEAIIKVGTPPRVEWLKVALRDPKSSPHR